MAGSNEIKYKVSVDSSRANRGLTQFSQAARSAGKDAVSALDDTASAGDKARAAIEAMAAAMETELRESTAAADALKVALGASADQFDVNEIVAKLNKMGVSFKDIGGEADKFADTLRKIDGATIKGVDTNARGAAAGMTDLRDKSDQSRSVLANLAGNAAQDLGEVGGVVGSLGVGIGQLAEYAVDGNIAMKNLAAVAGPMAALSAALLLVQTYMSGIAKQKAFEKQQVEGFTDAIDEVGVGAEAVLEHFQNINKIEFVSDTWFGLGKAVKDATEILGEFGISADEVARVVAGTTDEQEAWFAALEDTSLSGEDLGHIMEILRQQIESYDVAVERSEATAGLFTSSIEGINEAMRKSTVQTRDMEQRWKVLLGFIDQGKTGTQTFANTWNYLRDELDLTDAAMAELVQQKLDEHMADVAEQVDTAAEAVTAASDALRDARDNAAEFNHVISSADWGATTLQAAETALGGYFDAFHANRNEAVASAEAYETLGEAIEAADEEGLSWMETLTSVNSPEGRAVGKAYQELGQTLIPDIGRAFAESDGDIDTFRENMAELGEKTLVRLQDELGISRDEANFLAQQLGLVPGNVETMYELLGTEDAKLKLSLLQGVIDGLDPVIQNEITYAISIGDYQGALDAALRGAQAQANGDPVDLPVVPQLDEGSWRALRARIMNAAVNLPVYIGGSSVTSSAAAATDIGQHGDIACRRGRPGDDGGGAGPSDGGDGERQFGGDRVTFRRDAGGGGSDPPSPPAGGGVMEPRIAAVPRAVPVVAARRRQQL